MEGEYKIVDFHKYCPKCKHEKESATEDPCNECLSIPARIDSHKPEKFESK